MGSSVFSARFFLLNTFLLCLLIGRGKSENIYAETGVPLLLSLPQGTAPCQLTYPDKTKEDLPNCVKTITLLDAKKTGDYIITETTGTPKSITYTVYLLVSTLPSEPIVTVGVNLVITMTDTPAIKDVNSCTSDPSTLPGTGKSIAFINGRCGVQITNAQKEVVSPFKLLAKAINNELYASVISFTVYDTIKTDVVKVVEVHDFAHTTLNVYDTSAPVQYCYYETNNGVKTDIKPTCEYELSPATKSHEGIWFANTGYEGTIVEVKQQVNITVADTIGSTGTWKKNEKSQYELSCAVGKPITMCRFFQDSTNVTVSLSDGIGNADYQYLGKGLENGDCGMTILKENTAESDFWKCYWTEEKGTFSRFLILNNKNTSGNYISNVAGSSLLVPGGKSTVYAIVGMENVELECNVEGAVLDYCWFIAPDGAHRIPENINEHELRHGICKYNITVSERDRGTWTCRLGVFSRGAEMAKTITLEIRDSLLEAEYSGVEVRDNTATISCRVEDTFKEIRYCRYVRPDGYGLTLPFGGIANQYQSLNTEVNGKCELKINGVQNSDLGSWTCAVRLFESSINREHMASVYVYNPGLSGGQIAGIVIGVLLIVAAIGGILFYFLKIRRGR